MALNDSVCVKGIELPAQLAVTVSITSSIGIRSEQNGASLAGPRHITLGPATVLATPKSCTSIVTLGGKVAVSIALIVRSVIGSELRTSKVAVHTGGVLFPDTGPVTTFPVTTIGHTTDVCA